MDEALRAQSVPEDEFEGFYLPPAASIAPMVTWLCTEAADDVSAQVFSVKGTEVMQWTREADGASIVKENDPKGISTLDGLDELVSSRILSRDA